MGITFLWLSFWFQMGVSHTGAFLLWMVCGRINDLWMARRTSITGGPYFFQETPFFSWGGAVSQNRGTQKEATFFLRASLCSNPKNNQTIKGRKKSTLGIIGGRTGGHGICQACGAFRNSCRV